MLASTSYGNLIRSHHRWCSASGSVDCVCRTALDYTGTGSLDKFDDCYHGPCSVDWAEDSECSP